MWNYRVIISIFFINKSVLKRKTGTERLRLPPAIRLWTCYKIGCSPFSRSFVAACVQTPHCFGVNKIDRSHSKTQRTHWNFTQEKATKNTHTFLFTHLESRRRLFSSLNKFQLMTFSSCNWVVTKRFILRDKIFFIGKLFFYAIQGAQSLLIDKIICAICGSIGRFCVLEYGQWKCNLDAQSLSFNQLLMDAFVRKTFLRLFLLTNENHPHIETTIKKKR